MTAESRPLIVLAGSIHPDGKALPEAEARVVVCDDETEAGLVAVAADAVSGEMRRVLRGERAHGLVNPDVWPRLGIR